MEDKNNSHKHKQTLKNPPTKRLPSVDLAKDPPPVKTAAVLVIGSLMG